MKLLNHMTGGQDLKPCVFVIANEHIPKEAMTVTTTAHMGKADPVHYFTLGPATTISAETYDCPILYIGAGGSRGISPRRAGETMSQSGKTRSFMWRPGHSAALPEGRTDSCIQKSY